MSELRTLLQRHLGAASGAVALLARGEDIQVAAAGAVDVEGSAPMRRDTLFRIASVTKPIVAAAVMTLVDDGSLALDDPISRWLPELATPVVVREPAGDPTDVVPAARPITVEDVLSSRAGWGFPADFSLPVVGLLVDTLNQGAPTKQPVPAPDEWLAALATIPLLHQPGVAWLYNLCSDLQGVLISRVAGQSLPEFMAARIFRPLGMTDTGFLVPDAHLDRFTSLYQADQNGTTLLDRPDGQWSRVPTFPSGADGLVSTVDDWCAFGRMLLRGGRAADGTQVLSAESVRSMTNNCLTPDQQQAGSLFLDGQGWGFGGSVDVDATDPWTVPGRYGWIGGTGTSAHIDPSSDTVAVLFTQLAMTSPTAPSIMREFWTLARRP